MSYDLIYSIASQGMTLEKMRIDVVANNIANQHTLQVQNGPGFQPMQVVATAKPFNDYLNTGEAGLGSVDLVPTNIPLNKVYQPDHPAADKQGYLTYPGISSIDEMTTLLRASRAYEANIKVINTTHNLYLQALTIGEER
jgi:flagellar basal-body rod protein FlgC